MSLSRNKECENCNELYPEHLINHLVFKDKNCRCFKSIEVCPICALGLKRMFHRNSKYMFEGEIALRYYQEALEYDKRRSCNASTET